MTADLIVGEGIDAVTMEGVAAAAGVSKGLGYAYFSNRNELLRALAAWFETVRERGRLLGTLLQASQLQDALKDRRSRWHRDFEERWATMAETELGVPRRRAVAAFAILLAGMNGLLERWVDCGDSRTLLEEVYVGLAMGGLRALSDSA